MNKTTILILASLLITACSSRYASNGDMEYMKSQNGPALQIPTPLTSDSISHFYDLPPQTQTATVSILPPSAG